MTISVSGNETAHADDASAAVDNRSEIAQYAIADGASTSLKPWEFTHTSKRLVVVAWIAVAVIMAVHIFMAIVVGIGDTGVRVTPVDQWAFIGLGLIFSGLALSIMRPRVRANCDGVEVRNLTTARFYPWEVVYGLSFPRTARWARLELPEFEFVPLLAFQAGDGADVVKAVHDFSVLEDKYMPED
ncbi:PH domain-containing protein [Corynebacterium mendelii]|uniref:PH domain-containing protein n=1 Tax=Corynebacterium mendelii TaxID=2765362 RepID=UPI0036428FE9